MANAAGWYPDPWRPGRQRWWDGEGWTDHTHDPDAPVVPSPPAFVAPPNPRRDFGEEERAAVWARRAYPVWVIARMAGVLVSVITLPDTIDRFRDALDGKTTSSSVNDLQLLSTPLSMLTIAALIAIMIWSYKAATIASRLHYPAKRSTGWAVAGWLVPFVNFWFPYQTVRDCLPPGDPHRRLVGRWWLLYLLSTLGMFVPAVVSIVASTGIALALALALFVAAGFEAMTAARMIDAIEADHHAAVERITSG